MSFIWCVLIIIVAHVNSEVELSCMDSYCISLGQQLNCTVDGDFLLWNITDDAHNEQGIKLYNSTSDLNQVETLAAYFNVSLLPQDNQSNRTFSSTLQFIPNLVVNYNGYTVECNNNVSYKKCSIHIAGPPSAPQNLTLSEFTNTSTLLSWSPPSVFSQCVTGYIINSNVSNDTIEVTNTTTYQTLTVSENDHISNNTYCSTVAARDSGDREGNESSSLCFILDVPAPLIVNYVIENATLRINWTSDQKYRPHIENYNITASADGIDKSFNQQLQPSVTTYDLSLSDLTMYNVSKITVNVIASNILGYNKGSETTIILSIPTTTSESSSASSAIFSTSTVSSKSNLVTATTITTTTMTITESSRTTYHSTTKSEKNSLMTTTTSTFSTITGPLITTTTFTFSTITDIASKHSTSLLESSSSVKDAIPTESTGQDMSDGGKLPWAIIGGAAGGGSFVVIFLIVVFAFTCILKMKKRSEEYAITTLEKQSYRPKSNEHLYSSTYTSGTQPAIPMIERCSSPKEILPSTEESLYDDTIIVQRQHQKEPATYMDPAAIQRVTSPAGIVYTVPQRRFEADKKNTRDGDYAELVFDGSDKSSAVGGDQQDRAQVDGTVVNYADIRK